MIASKEDKESEPLYWMGKSINAMTIDELKTALISANTIIIDQQKKLYRLEQLDHGDEFNC